MKLCHPHTRIALNAFKRLKGFKDTYAPSYDGRTNFLNTKLMKRVEQAKVIALTDQKKNPDKKRKKFDNSHLLPLKVREKGFVKDYVATGSLKEAALRNYNVQEKSAAQVGSVVFKRERVQNAVQIELEMVDEKYIENGLVRLENKCDVAGDLSTQRNVYETMMKLKGLGSTKVVNENTEKKQFEFHDPKELREQLILTISDLANSGLIDLPDFIEDLSALDKLRLPEEQSEVLVI